MTDAVAAEAPVLSIDQASALIGELPKKAPEPEQPVTQPQEPNTAEPSQPTGTAEPETATGTETEGATETQTEGEQPEQLAPLEAPQFLKASIKANWDKLPREVQEGLIEQDQEVRSSTGKALEKSATERKAAEEAKTRYSQLADATSQVLTKAQATFKSRWEGVDWSAVADTYGTDQAFKLRTQMENEAEQLKQLQTANEIAEREQLQNFRKERAQQFQALIPEFVDPKTGPQKQQEVFDFLRAQGIPDDVIINRASAVELALAVDAMKWRNAQAEAKKLASAPAKPAPVKTTPAKPAAQATARTPQQSRIDQLSRKRSLTIDEAVELANLKDQAA
jgi:hypothetical protein